MKRDRQRRKLSAAAGAALGVTLAFGAVAAATISQDSNTLPAANEPMDASADGQRGVVAANGEYAGSISSDALQSAAASGEPPLRLGGSEVDFRGFEVYSDSGVLAGYFLPGDNGFVSLEDVADPERLAEIEAVWLRDVESWENPTAEMLQIQEEQRRSAAAE